MLYEAAVTAAPSLLAEVVGVHLATWAAVLFSPFSPTISRHAAYPESRDHSLVKNLSDLLSTAGLLKGSQEAAQIDTVP